MKLVCAFLTLAGVTAFRPSMAPKMALEANRRDALKAGAALAAAAPLVSNVAPAAATEEMYKIPDLPYAFDALEPYIDTATMKFHWDKHNR